MSWPTNPLKGRRGAVALVLLALLVLGAVAAVAGAWLLWGPYAALMVGGLLVVYLVERTDVL